ncbi:vitamin B12 dependent-methionine synthase activation domain-containing protein [Parabacteroides pacaensis]|uniref:vitamin B12 dependent-methionine synthase activation domain-containing protein n=1 Tax=Parabacteroides pacaensis TaxID=2086575 RepID=UPI000D112E5D|nr:vitamin B12 dependent-methionine synthase activation domain-containing protein [Parabacteroides pacaensis]
MDDFVPYYPTIEEINLQPGDVLDIFHVEEDCSSDNPIVAETMQVYEQMHELSEIQGGYVIFDDIKIFSREGRIQINNRTIHPAAKICSYLQKARQIAVFICTAGEGFTQKAVTYNQQGDYLKGYITDTFGSLVVEKAMDYIQSELDKQMQKNGMKITNRYSPGYCNWEVNDQKQIFDLLPEKACGISLTNSCLMVPIKSVSGIIGIGPEVRKNDYGCDICNNITCIFRKIKNKENRIHH